MMTTGSPSAKLGSSSARASTRALRTSALDCQPRSSIMSATPWRAISASRLARSSPSPISTTLTPGNSSFTAASAAGISSRPFCELKRAMLTSTWLPGFGVGAKSGIARPQWTISILGQWRHRLARTSCTRPKLEIAMMNAAWLIFRSKLRRSVFSNSSGPCAVKL